VSWDHYHLIASRERLLRLDLGSTLTSAAMESIFGPFLRGKPGVKQKEGTPPRNTAKVITCLQAGGGTTSPPTASKAGILASASFFLAA
jgi:hypothetical protein